MSWDSDALRIPATAYAQTLGVIHPISETRLISYANGDHPGDIRIRSRFSKLELSFVRPIEKLAHNSPGVILVGM